jgi:hypothetical protein
MALLPWDDEEQKKEDLFNPAPIKSISSLQSGAWQPAPSGADSAVATDGIATREPEQQNYLLSDEKAQRDEAQRQKQAAEAARAAAVAEQADAARRAEAAAAVAAESSPEAAPKYVPEQQKDEGFVGFLRGVGAGIQQGVGALGDIAIQGGGLIGSIGKNDQELVKHLENVEKVRSWLHGNKDIVGNEIVGTRDVEQQATDIAMGRGDIQDFAAVGGKGLQAGIDATMFLNPARIALKGAPAAVNPVVSSANLATKVFKSPAVRYAARDAAFFGSLQGTATFQSVYGETGDFEQAMEAALQDAAIGATLQGGLDLGGSGINAVANRTVNSLRRPRELTPAGEINPAGEVAGVIEAADGGVGIPENVRPDSVPTDSNVTFDTNLDQPAGVPGDTASNLTPVIDTQTPVADGVVTPVENPVDNATPTTVTPVENIQAPTPEVTPVVADGVVQPSKVLPAAVDPNVPVIKSEEVRKLQEARAGASQADEAVINQKLQEAEANIPSIENNYSLKQSRGGSVYAELPDGTKVTIPKTVQDALYEQKQGNPLSEADFNRIDKWEKSLVRSGGSSATTAVSEGKTRNVAPVKEDSVPVMETPTDGKLTPAQVAERLMPKLADNKDIKQRIADSVGMGKDVASDVRDILKQANVKPKRAERVATGFDKLDKQVQEYNRLEELNQKAYAEGGADALDPEVSKSRSRAARELGITTRRLLAEIKRLEGHKDKKVALLNNINNIIGTRNANVLTSAGLLERNIFQELTANAKLAIKNPIKMARSTFNSGNIVKDTAKSELSHWADLPSINPVEIVKYVVGNTYRTAMIPTTVLANTRRGAVREEFTKWAYKELEGRELSSAEAKKLSGTAGNELEALVNTFVGVDNGMTNRGQATAAMKAWKEYIRTGDDGAKADFLGKVEQHNSLADQMIAGLSKDDQTKARGLKAMGNLIFPFVRTSTNFAINTVKQDLNPMAKSLLDEIRVDQRSGGKNAVNLIKSKLVDYGIMGGAALLATSGVLVYNDGEDVDKPRGWSLKVGDNNYVPVRSTSLELPIALAGTAQAIARDVAAGKPRDWQYYAKMVTQSLPYIDQMNTTTGALDSLTSGEDAGYAAKAYGVNMAKSFVPGSNNGVQPYIAGKKGESLNAKSVYDENLVKWFTNTVQKSYDPEFYNSLKDSRDNAGRVRTVDNQGVVSNKTMNDAGTAEFNDRITDLVDYGREAGLGKNTKDMFNTYDTGKNNNFKSVQDSITFLDAVDGKPDNTKKLEKNAKLTDLSSQVREGFYGDTGNELLTLNGKNLYSDVSVPGKYGGKNTRLPLSMESIKNAIGQTDLPEDQRNTLYEIGQQKEGLYERRKSGEITYEQEQAMRAEIGAQELSLLENSESYQKMLGLMDELDDSGFFDADGLGSTRSGQTYLWNSLNALLGSKGATPAANYPKDDKGFTPWGRGGNGRSATNKPGDRKNTGVKWSPVTARKQAAVKTGKYTPVQIKVKLGNEVKKNKTQNYSDRSF